MGQLGVTLGRKVKRPGRDSLCKRIPGHGHLGREGPEA